MNDLIEQLVNALESAETHLDYCGYGDSWEREGAIAEKLPEKIAEALKVAKEHLNGKD